ncbi:ectoine synthase [Pelagibius marinus]|uniref:ectoine synthase n=1 Tax=Pelagibius marinus TaxID=2762760 RepID=UPI001872778F|nr:ectoine synthase [Pelagibius marinus]
MIVRSFKEARETSRRITADNWESIRLALGDDELGFSFHITTMYAKTTTSMHYKNHIELVYCISGEGELFDVVAGRSYPIAPGTLYILDKNDPHRVTAESDLVIACVFRPALQGREVHDADGAYPLLSAAEAAHSVSR